MKHDLTSNAASTIVEQLHQRMVKLGLPIPLLFTKAVLAALTFVGVTYVEYEILYRVFESVAGTLLGRKKCKWKRQCDDAVY
jgi:hypothetical protein